MPTSQLRKVIHQLQSTLLLHEASDGQLLEHFVSRHENVALEVLVRRHGPMVWGVCRRILVNHQDAEDAFQATFLVLVRKAASIVPREMIGNWLYGVAHQTALKARATTAKRKKRETQVTTMPEAGINDQDDWSDLQPLLDRELSKLPDKYRVVVLLCDLEGKTRKEAARQIGCPEGTVATRLARGRGLLAKRLGRHGLAVSGGSVAALLAQNASARVPASVVSSTIKVASFFAAGQRAMISVKVIALMDGVLKTMLLTKLKTVLTAVLMMGIIAFGGGLITFLHSEAQPGQTRKPVGEKEAVKADKDKTLAKEKHPMDRIQAAYDATKSALRSGLGSGQFEVYTAPDQKKDLTVAIKGKIRVAITGNRYYVRIDYERHPSDIKASIIICDGDNLYKSDFSDRIIPTGNMGHINEVRKVGEDNSYSMGPHELDYLNPAMLFDRPIRPGTIKKLYSTSLRITGDHHTGYLGTYEHGKTMICEFHALPEHGFRVSSFKEFLDNKAYLCRSINTIWERSGDIWYVKTAEENRTFKNGPPLKTKWTYNEFEPNAEIPESYFKFGALKLVEGTRIFDHRIKDKAVEYRNVPLKDVDAASVDKIADYVQKLAATNP